MGAKLIRFHELQAEIKHLSAEGERMRAEPDELQHVLSRLSALLETAPPAAGSRRRRKASRVSQPVVPGVSGSVTETTFTGEAPMSDKTRLLRDADEAFVELRESIDGLSDAEMRRVWLGSWGVREILIHISGWHDEMAPALGRVAKGQEAYPAGTYDDFDAWNARFVEQKTGVKTADVIAELEASHRAFIAAAAAVPEPFFAPGAAPVGPFCGRGRGAPASTWRRSASGATERGSRDPDRIRALRDRGRSLRHRVERGRNRRGAAAGGQRPRDARAHAPSLPGRARDDPAGRGAAGDRRDGRALARRTERASIGRARPGRRPPVRRGGVRGAG